MMKVEGLSGGGGFNPNMNISLDEGMRTQSHKKKDGCCSWIKMNIIKKL
jgi:hypothetical protein